jgi:threonyl-tRNA synthetase
MVNFEQSKTAFWHSSAHILGSAIEKTFQDALLTVGPPTKDGFFYDFYSPQGKVV